jgi:hypothetical protein
MPTCGRVGWLPGLPGVCGAANVWGWLPVALPGVALPELDPHPNPHPYPIITPTPYTTTTPRTTPIERPTIDTTPHPRISHSIYPYNPVQRHTTATGGVNSCQDRMHIMGGVLVYQTMQTIVYHAHKKPPPADVAGGGGWLGVMRWFRPQPILTLANYVLR